jgi:hypothetical protein
MNATRYGLGEVWKIATLALGIEAPTLCEQVVRKADVRNDVMATVPHALQNNTIECLFHDCIPVTR